tara:strand:- start:725 stop:1303 length:579 start_codon:yes stop_codon:yes gene_type:complete
MDLYLILIVSYFIGSIPFGFILTKVFLRKDLRKVGSGNIGATNALRTGNKLIGYSTLFLDISKTIIPLLIVKIYFENFVYISAFSLFVGHVFPIWLKFKGGKGVASYVGILFCLNYKFVLIFVISWIIIFIISKLSSLSSLIATLSVPVYLIIFDHNFNNNFFFIMFIFIMITHRENIKRLINGTESRTKIY